MRDVTENDLKRALPTSTVPVVALFARSGSAPSDELVDAVKSVERELGKRFDVVKLDLDKCKQLAEEQRIHREPELLVWAPGGARLLARTEGAMRADEVLGLLEHALTRQ